PPDPKTAPSARPPAPLDRLPALVSNVPTGSRAGSARRKSTAALHRPTPLLPAYARPALQSTAANNGLGHNPLAGCSTPPAIAPARPRSATATHSLAVPHQPPRHPTTVHSGLSSVRSFLAQTSPCCTPRSPVTRARPRLTPRSTRISRCGAPRLFHSRRCQASASPPSACSATPASPETAACGSSLARVAARPPASRMAHPDLHTHPNKSAALAEVMLCHSRPLP